jgi:hypothetical protein
VGINSLRLFQRGCINWIALKQAQAVVSCGPKEIFDMQSGRTQQNLKLIDRHRFAKQIALVMFAALFQ